MLNCASNYKLGKVKGAKIFLAIQNKINIPNRAGHKDKLHNGRLLQPIIDP